MSYGPNEPDHICDLLGELQPECDGYYCRLEREQLALDAALRGGETALEPDVQLAADISLIVDYELASRNS